MGDCFVAIPVTFQLVPFPIIFATTIAMAKFFWIAVLKRFFTHYDSTLFRVGDRFGSLADTQAVARYSVTAWFIIVYTNNNKGV